MNTDKVRLFGLRLVPVVSGLLFLILAFQGIWLSKDDRETQARFQRDSELLVVGKVLSDKISLPDGRFGLGTVKTPSFVVEGRTLDAYDLLTNQKHPRQSEEWDRGFGRKVAAVSLLRSPELERFLTLGSELQLANGERRFILRLETDNSRYVSIFLSGAPIAPGPSTISPERLSLVSNGEAVPLLAFDPYVSSFGLQGYAAAYLYNHLGLSGISLLRLLVGFAFALVLALVGWSLRPFIGEAGVLVFLLVSVASPWLVNFAQNLFWVPFLWFLPLLIALLMVEFQRWRLVLVLCLGLAVFVKSLCGYEYISAILILAISPFFLAMTLPRWKKERLTLWKWAVAASIAALLGFSAAILVHAGVRSDNVFDGLVSIWNADVLRRTLGGEPSSFPEVYRDSLTASPLEVIGKYILSWNGYLFFGVPGGVVFPMLLATVSGLVVWGLIRNRDRYLPIAIGLLLSFLACVSWLALAKAHSFIHTHINFVLWYFGFVQYSVLLIVMFVKPFVPRIIQFLGRVWRSL